MVKNSFHLLGVKLLTLVMAGVGLGLPGLVLAATAQTNTYLVQFMESGQEFQLSTVGKDINERFTFSGNSSFKNIYSFSSDLTLSELYQSVHNVKIIQLDRTIGSADTVLNDPGFTKNPLNIDKQWGLVKAGFPAAWDKTTGSASNVVGVIDTGMDATHEDLQSINLVDGYNFITKQLISGRVNSDDNGHGTLIAGVLGATANNNTGIVGTNWKITLMPLKALDASGKGDSGTVSEAIVWAADHGAQFINLSLGGIGFGHDTILSDAISYAFSKNIFIAAAAGNDVATSGGNLDLNPVFPICDDNDQNMIVGVTAVDLNDLKPEFANYGQHCIDVSAPGRRVLSTISIDPITKNIAPNSYAFASGTSLAVPFVVGEAALIKSLYPNALNIQLRDQIIATADPIDNLNLTQCGGFSCKSMIGSGRINVQKALAATLSQQVILEGDLVKASSGNTIYQISGGQKRMISPFVFNQRFAGNSIKVLPDTALSDIPVGQYATPLEGTLIKLDTAPTVFIVSKGLKLPVTFSVFKQRGFRFESVNTVSFPEFNSWLTGSFYPPSDGTLLRTPKNKTVYWVVGGSLHPITFQFYVSRGLRVFPILSVPDNDIDGFSKGETYK